MRAPHSVFRRRVAAVTTAVVVASLLSVVASPQPAMAAIEPSVPLPSLKSTPVNQQVMEPRGRDEASDNALRGEQTVAGRRDDGGGTAKATSLAPSATWQVSPQTGDFTWSYPLRVPPAPGGLEPGLALSYASSTVDGRTSATNNQASWVGDGWDLSVGFIERGYLACSDDDMGDVKPPKTMGDLCWRSNNATASYNGGGGQLICCDGQERWRAKSDDGSRIELKPGVANGDDDGEHWVITAVDGTQYFFGSRPEAKSTWTVPVYGDDSNEPCHSTAGLTASGCVQAWRWNLDKVIDRNGNIMLYQYETETNSYGKNGTETAASYVRGGFLRSVEYGMRADQAASAQVEFIPGDRCVPGSNCTANPAPANALNWPDVPWEMRCAAATCGVNRAPTFWSTKRLAKVVSRIRAEGGGFTDVDSWTLDHQFPQTGDGEQPALWLKSIVHTGHVGVASPLPPVTFQGRMMPNRVYKVNGLARLNRYRVTGILSESGGLLSVNYADVNCVEGSSMPPNSHTNTLRCFPVTWTKKDDIERTEYFHKYVVESIVQSDRFPDLPTANMEQVTSFEYKDGAAWHYDTSEFTKEEKKTWDEFRGYGKVVIRTGDQRVDGAPVSKVEKRFYRGMHGDKLPSGTLAAQVTPSEGAARNDEDWLNGTTLETITYDGDTDTVVSKTIDTPVWGAGPTAVRDAFKAYQVRTGTSETWTALAAGGRRRTKTETAYDDRGLVTKINDLGDTANGADDRCTKAGYARNSEKWLMSFPSSVETVAVACGVAPAFPADAISDLLYFYDGNGNVVETKALKERPAAEPVYEVAGKATYDEHGRVKTTTDTYGKVTKTTYTPVKGGPTTGTVTTNPLGHTTTTTLNPAWGLPTTVVDANLRKTVHAYDALGRLTEVWLPNRKSSDGASVKVTYKINGDAPSVVTTSRINANGNYVTTKDIYDGLLRLRQSQAPAVGGGRLLTDTRYDSHGRPYKSTQPFFNNAAIDDKLWVASDVEIPGHTVTVYDGVDRVTNEIYMGGATEQWRTVFTYGGDRVNVTPPKGGVAATTITDARGQVTELRQYRGPKPEGVYDPTSYTYTDAGLLASVTDPAGNAWRYDYDVRGNQIKAADPDKGTATMTYDKGNRLETVTDARGTKLTYTYDDLGRKTLVASGETELASWTYDTATKGVGQLATATSYVDDAPYTRSVASYSALYHPTETSVTIPETPRARTLAGTYTTTSALNADGTPYNMTLPAIGDLRKETVSWEYDELSNPTKLSGGPEATGTFEYITGTEYTGYGEAARIQLGQIGERVWRSYYYDDHTRRLKRSIVDAEVPRPMQTDVNYTYDDAGNITSIADIPKDLSHDVQCFRYDHLRRLTEAWTGATNQWDEDDGCTGDPTVAASPAPYWHSYTYDVAGNRLTETQHAAGGDTLREYNYPAAGAHRLDSVTTKSPGPSKTDRFTYDATGNSITRNAQKLDWDALGKLSNVTEGDKSTRFVYDADGNRLIREDPTSITLYLDGQDLRLDRTTGAKTATRYYGSVAARTTAGVTWLAGDHQNTGMVAIEAETLKVTQRQQTPFGAPRGAPVPWVGEKGFVGGITDASTGLTHLGAREYDPSIGRFISVDPIMDVRDTQQMHGYTYANNSPVTLNDANGLAPCGGPDGEGCKNNTKQTNRIQNFCGGQFCKSGGGRQVGPVLGSDAPGGDNQGWKDRRKSSGATGCGRGRGTCGGGGRVKAPTGKEMPTGKNIGMRPISPSLGISFSEGAHFLLDGCGMIPLFGELCDAGNALWYLAEGDPLNAGVSVAGMIPIGGQAATGGRAAANVVDGVKSACSFDGGTEVMMADGTTKPIKDVEIGDRVLATDPETGEEGPRVVTRRWVHDDTLVDLELADGTVVTTTEDHPFWNATDRAWQRADRLDRGDDLHSATGQRIKVNGLAASTQKIAVAYNLTVDAIHTYYVLAGNTPVLVHNTGPCDVPTPNITQKGLDHSFDRHAEQWFGRPVTKTDKMGEWNALIERAAGSTKAVPWSSGSTLTNAHLARVDGKWFVAQFDRSNGQLVTAFVPNNGQVGAMLNLLGK